MQKGCQINIHGLSRSIFRELKGYAKCLLEDTFRFHCFDDRDIPCGVPSSPSTPAARRGTAPDETVASAPVLTLGPIRSRSNPNSPTSSTPLQLLSISEHLPTRRMKRLCTTSPVILLLTLLSFLSECALIAYSCLHSIPTGSQPRSQFPAFVSVRRQLLATTQCYNTIDQLSFTLHPYA